MEYTVYHIYAPGCSKLDKTVDSTKKDGMELRRVMDRLEYLCVLRDSVCWLYSVVDSFGSLKSTRAATVINLSVDNYHTNHL